MALCILYIGGPLKDPIGFGLHQIAHALGQPAVVLGHEISNAHSSWEHKMDGASHEHSLVEAFTSFFEALEQHDQQNEMAPSIAFLDKHFAREGLGVLDWNKLHSDYPDLSDLSLSEGIRLIEIPPPIS